VAYSDILGSWTDPPGRGRNATVHDLFVAHALGQGLVRSVPIFPFSTEMEMSVLNLEAIGRGHVAPPTEGILCDGQEPALGIEGLGPVPFLRATSHLMMKERAGRRSIGMMLMATFPDSRSPPGVLSETKRADLRPPNRTGG